jgi:hypothetical protein
MTQLIKKILKVLMFPLYIYAALERIFAFILSALLMFTVFTAGDLNIVIRAIIFIISILSFVYSIGKLKESGVDGGSGGD